MENKTTITIAHRLNTIRNSNIIYVLENGCLIEQGRYEELIAKKGYFYHLEKGIEIID
jgi:ABC-type multidrug transport system fused ATPase/permease subunit